MYLRLKWVLPGVAFLAVLIIVTLFYFNTQKAATPPIGQTLKSPSVSSFSSSPQKSSPAPSSQKTKPSTLIIIDMKGEVKHPGVYRFHAGQRILDAVEMAGGFTSAADQTSINLAQKLTDEMVVIVPKKGEKPPVNPASTAQSANGSSSDSPIIHLNSATLEQLQLLPGVGPSKAQAILKYREENGPFQQIEDLTKVTGIGPKSLEKMKGQIELN